MRLRLTPTLLEGVTTPGVDSFPSTKSSNRLSEICVKLHEILVKLCELSARLRELVIGCVNLGVDSF